MCFDHSASFPQSLHSNSPLDISIKGQMIRDLLNLAGFVLPNAEEIVSSSSSSSSSTARSASLLFRSRLAACTAPSCPSEGMVAGHSLLLGLPCCAICPTVTHALLPCQRPYRHVWFYCSPAQESPQGLRNQRSTHVDVPGPSLLFPGAGPFTPLPVSVL